MGPFTYNPRSKRRQRFAEVAPDWLSGASKLNKGKTATVPRQVAPKQTQTQIVAAPITAGGVTRGKVPRMINRLNGLTVVHSETISTLPLTAGGVLNYFTLAMIPGLFPYLSGVASNFGKYKWRRLLIRYVPACPSTTEGESAMGLYFDRQDAVAATFVQVTSMQRAISFPPWAGFGNGKEVNIVVDCNEFDKNRYSYMTTANFVALSASDENNYCPVTLATATQGSTAGAPVGGRIWADYEIELTDPIVPGLNT